MSEERPKTFHLLRIHLDLEGSKKESDTSETPGNRLSSSAVAAVGGLGSRSSSGASGSARASSASGCGSGESTGVNRSGGGDGERGGSLFDGDVRALADAM